MKLLKTLLLCLFLAVGIQSNAQSGSSLPLINQPYQLGSTYQPIAAGTYNLGPFRVTGLGYYIIQWVVSGTVTGCTFTLDGSAGDTGSFTTGSLVTSQTCNTSGSYVNSTPVVATRAQLAATLSNTGTVRFTILGFTTNPNTSAANNGVSNSNGQATSANSAPVVIASDQSPVPTTVSSWGGGVLGAMANYGTSPGTVLVPGMNAFITNTPAVTQSGTWNIGTLTGITNNVNTQPAGFSSLVSFQQSVTSSAVVLATNSVHGFCVKALNTNALTVYVGGSSGVTSGTGYPLGPGDFVCYQGSNTNLAYVIASSGGSSIAVTGN